MSRMEHQRVRIFAWTCALLVAALVIPGFAADKRAMTFMDVIEMRSVGAGKISPDGQWVAYKVATPDK